MSFETIQSDQTDPGSPIDKQLMDQGLRLNMDALNTAISNVSGIPFAYTVWTEDFLGRVDSTALTVGANLVYGVSGSGAAISSPTTSPLDNTHVGVLQLSTGTTTTGYVNLIGLHSIFVGNGEATIEFLVRVEDLSTAGEEYCLFLGLTQAPTTITTAEGIYMKYNRLTSANWLYNCRSASTGTEQVSSVAVTADTWWRLRIVINSAGTSVSFYAGSAGGDLALLGTVTTNIPSGWTAPCVLHAKSAGSTARLTYIDYMYVAKTITGGR
jgi:hypothetical protein